MWACPTIPALVRIARPGDVVMTLGAGSIGSVVERLLDALAANADSAAGSGA